MPLLALLSGGIPWKLVGYIAGALAVAGLFLFFVGTIKENGRLKVMLDSAIEVSNNNSKIAETQRKETVRIEVIYTEVVREKVVIRKESDAVRKEIANAPASDDGPIAPVLRRELDRLRQHQGANKTPATTVAGNPR